MDEILFEYIKQGIFVKVTAIDAVSGTEAVIVVPAGLSEKQMQKQAVRKLSYILKKKIEIRPKDCG